MTYYLFIPDQVQLDRGVFRAQQDLREKNSPQRSKQLQATSPSAKRHSPPPKARLSPKYSSSSFRLITIILSRTIIVLFIFFVFVSKYCTSSTHFFSLTHIMAPNYHFVEYLIFDTRFSELTVHKCELRHHFFKGSSSLLQSSFETSPIKLLYFFGF